MPILLTCFTYTSYYIYIPNIASFTTFSRFEFAANSLWTWHARPTRAMFFAPLSLLSCSLPSSLLFSPLPSLTCSRNFFFSLFLGGGGVGFGSKPFLNLALCRGKMISMCCCTAWSSDWSSWQSHPSSYWVSSSWGHSASPRPLTKRLSLDAAKHFLASQRQRTHAGNPGSAGEETMLSSPSEPLPNVN